MFLKQKIIVACIWIGLIIFMQACQKGSYDKLVSENQMLVLVGGASGLLGPQCSDVSPPFSTVSTLAVTDQCNTCHKSGGVIYDITNYNDVKARVIDCDPAGSLLYQKITNGGSMVVNLPSPALVQAVYDWIKGGAAP